MATLPGVADTPPQHSEPGESNLLVSPDVSTMALIQKNHILQRLKTVKTAHGDNVLAVELERVLPLLQKPALEHFEGRQVDCTELAYSDLFESKIRTIRLHHCLLDASGLSYLLRSCPLLESMAVVIGDSSIGDCFVDFDEVGDVLREHGTKLQSLTFAFSPHYTSLYSQTEPLGSLQTLSLRRLSFPMTGFLASESYRSSDEDEEEDEDGYGEARTNSTRLYNLLPPSLETLEPVRAWDFDFEASHRAQVTELFTSRSMPSLQRALVQDVGVFERVG